MPYNDDNARCALFDYYLFLVLDDECVYDRSADVYIQVSAIYHNIMIGHTMYYGGYASY